VGKVRNQVQAVGTTMTKKIRDVRLGEAIQIGTSTFVKITTNGFMKTDAAGGCKDPVLTSAGASKTFTYTGNYQTFTAYAGCDYKIELWGAQGGSGVRLGGAVTGNGGAGSYTSGAINFPANTNLYVYVGQKGVNAKSGTIVTATAWNGGGTGAYDNQDGDYGGGGGYWGGSYAIYNAAQWGSPGSSYISGHNGCNSLAASATSSNLTFSGQADHYSGNVFADTVMIDGAGYPWTNTRGALQQMPNPSGGYYASGTGHTGHGAARITRLN